MHNVEKLAYRKMSARMSPGERQAENRRKERVERMRALTRKREAARKAQKKERQETHQRPVRSFALGGELPKKRPRLEFFMDEGPETSVVKEDSLGGGEACRGEGDALDIFMADVYREVESPESSIIKKPDEVYRVVPKDDDSFDPLSAPSDEECFKPLEEDRGKEYFGLIRAGTSHVKKELQAVDHSTISYTPLKKNIYLQVREVSAMTPSELESFRRTNGEIKIRGRHAPRPISSFSQLGLTKAVMDRLRRKGIEKPFPIQMQVPPAMLCGRDVLGIAATGSGKTLAYVLPLLRHCLAQPVIKQDEGPLALILAPTRELALQIYLEAGGYAKRAGVRIVPAIGGYPIGKQLGALRRGCEVVVATPGRMVDVLTISNGKVTNLLRVGFVVVDEADRMLDLGFAAQLEKLLENIRPDRQLCLFSATFPKSLEKLVRQMCYKPLEISCGARNAATKSVLQFAEVIPVGKPRMMRLLQLLGEWLPIGRVMVFVSSQNAVDEIFLHLVNYGYDPTTLHGALDHDDRDNNLRDFKYGVKRVLVATSVAARGLDIKDCVLVVNFEPPDHVEEYIHRVGRTGRAKQLGAAYTFIAADEIERAEAVIEGLETADAEVPLELLELKLEFDRKLAAGVLKKHISNITRGSGFKFTEKSAQQNAIAESKIELYKFFNEVGADEDKTEEEIPIAMITQRANRKAMSLATAALSSLGLAAVKVDSRGEKKSTTAGGVAVPPLELGMSEQGVVDVRTGNIVDRLVINDWPTAGRLKLCERATLKSVIEDSGADCRLKGQFVDAAWALENPEAVEHIDKLYIQIVAATANELARAKGCIHREMREAL